MATIPVGPATVSKTISGNSPQTLVLPEAASQTFVVGEFVYLSGGYVNEIGDQPSLIAGMAAKKGKNSATAVADLVQSEFFVVNADTIFSLSKTNSSGTAAATTATDIGAEFALYRDTTNSWTTAYRPAVAGYYRCMCIGLDGRDALGTVGGRLLLVFLGNYRQLSCTS